MSRDERDTIKADRQAKFNDKMSADRAKKIGDRTVWVQKYLSTGGFNNDASRMSEMGFDVVTQASNRSGGGLTVTYRKRSE